MNERWSFYPTLSYIRSKNGYEDKVNEMYMGAIMNERLERLREANRRNRERSERERRFMTVGDVLKRKRGKNMDRLTRELKRGSRPVDDARRKALEES